MLSEKRKEYSEEQGLLNDGHESIREILTEYNDTLRGRCAICLENFKEEENKN
jgi:hypothetical protein